MTIGAYVGVLLTLGLVLGLLVLTLRVVRRFAPTAGSGRQRVPMEIVQRLAIGPRQGIAVVRIGESVVAVSIGEGGIRALVELSDADRDAIVQGNGGQRSAVRVTPVASSFTDALKAAMRPGAKMLAIGALGLSAMLAPVHAQAQGRSAAAPVSPAEANRTAKSAAPAIGTGSARADSMLTRLAPRLDLKVGGNAAGDGLRLSGTVGVVVMLGLLTLLPTLLLMMTGFTRILIVLHFLRQALGTQSAPPSQLIAALALLLTGFVMAPTLSEVNRTALQPWMDGKIEQAQMMSTAVKPFREFMLRQTRERDIETFVGMSQAEPPRTPEDVPLVVLVSAFVTSELRTAFQIGFALFLPFIVIDVVVSSVLMSMGMFMLPPAMISLPFKLLLFVLVDGWSLVVQSLVQSFK